MVTVIAKLDILSQNVTYAEVRNNVIAVPFIYDVNVFLKVLQHKKYFRCYAESK